MRATSNEQRVTSTRHRRVGLLGGSFNPAHEGHVHVSLTALKALKLDEVWWLVSPQNPLKPKKDLASYETRLGKAREIAEAYREIKVTDLEEKKGLNYTCTTVRYLLRHFPHTHFIWLMGADNLAQFHRWRRWREIAARIPFAVFDRAPVTHSALRSPAATACRQARLSAGRMAKCLTCQLPVWAYVFMVRHSASATALRKKLGKSAFLAHNKSG